MTGAKIRTRKGRYLTVGQYLGLAQAQAARTLGGGPACRNGHFSCAAWEGGPCSDELRTGEQEAPRESEAESGPADDTGVSRGTADGAKDQPGSQARVYRVGRVRLMPNRAGALQVEEVAYLETKGSGEWIWVRTGETRFRDWAKAAEWARMVREEHAEETPIPMIALDHAKRISACVHAFFVEEEETR